MKKVETIIERIRAEHVPDFRSGIFDVRVETRDGRLVLSGETTHTDAAEQLLAEAGKVVKTGIVDEIVRLPDPALGAGVYGVVRAAIVPVYLEPSLPAAQISQLVLGMRFDLLARRGDWLRVRAEDGYLGWIHDGYVRLGEREWAERWERGSYGEPVVSLGAELVDEEGNALARLPWGARVLRFGSTYELPDGRRGTVGSGEVVDVDRLADRFPARGDSIARTARRWHGTPYLWGGVTMSGADCSGFAQAVMWMHGIALPRDSDLQARIGVPVDPGEDFSAVRPGDLLFFAEHSARVSHVAISLGGPLIIHSALGNGGVAVNTMTGELDFERRLRRLFTEVRRLLPD
jgi:hypothetical protein